MSLSKREIFLLCILLICGIAYAYYTYAYEPLQARISATASENQKLKKEIEQLKQVKPHQDGQSSDVLQKIKEDFYTAAAKVPTYPMIPESIAFLEKSGRDAGIDLKSLDISDPGNAQASAAEPGAPAGNGLIKQNYELAGTGGYFALSSFLMKIEESPRIYIISNLDIGSQPVSTVPATASTTTAGPATTGTTATTARIYDGSNLTFTLSVSSYYDQIELEEIGSMFETVQPSAGRNNPFSS